MYTVKASLVLYKTPLKQLNTIISCVNDSIINKLYLIDNSPTNELERIVNSYKSDKIVYVFNNSNIGYGAGHNIAIRKAMEENATYHVVLNPDILFEPEAISNIASFLDTNLDVGQVLPKVTYPNGDLQYLCKLIPTPMDLIFKRFLPAKWTKKRLHKFQLRFTGYDRIMNVPYLSGCFMFFRISALKEIGLFDERFFMYPEDIDITRRMHRRYRTIFYPYVSIIHAHAAESYKSKKMLWIHISNMVRYFNKWGWFFDSERNRINKNVLSELNTK